MPEVEVRELVKHYPKADRNAVDGVSFTVARGEVFGLLGPNGAGKTTTVGVLTTRVRATSGAASVGGVDVVSEPVRARSVLAVVPQRNNLDRSLSIRDNLLFHAAYHGVPRATAVEHAVALLEQFGLADRAKDKPDRFSGGQSQRVMIARAMMHQPRVLFLDEPSTGLDPAARLFVWERVREMQAAGKTIVLTTHDMEEATQLSDRVAIMDHGTLLAMDSPAALTRSLPGSETLDVTVALAGAPADDVLGDLRALPGVERVDDMSTDGAASLAARVYVGGKAPALVATVAARVGERGGTLTDVSLGRPSLEDVFIHLTGRALR